MTKVEFFGGVGVIGSTKVLIGEDGWRILLDAGLDIPSAGQLFRPPAAPHPGRELADRLRIGGAPRIPHLYRDGGADGTGLETGSDGRTAVFISHAHLDHIGLAGWIDPGISIYASPGTARMMRALESAGMGQDGGVVPLTPLADDSPIKWGPFEVRRFDVDHDVDGASGYMVRTGAGVLAYTGDIRWHGRHHDRTTAFADAARHADFLVLECTGLSSDTSAAPRSEDDVDADFARGLDETPGLVLTTIYPRNVDRARAFADIAAAHGRVLLFPTPLFEFLSTYGIAGIERYDEGRVGDIAARPGRYVVQLQPEATADLLDLPTGPGAQFLHADGEPLGAFDPRWEVLEDWLRFTGTPIRLIGSSGHCSPGDLHRLLARIAPAVVFPLHTAAPHRLIPPAGTYRVLAERGRTYDLAELLSERLLSERRDEASAPARPRAETVEAMVGAQPDGATR